MSAAKRSAPPDKLARSHEARFATIRAPFVGFLEVTEIPPNTDLRAYWESAKRRLELEGWAIEPHNARYGHFFFSRNGERREFSINTCDPRTICIPERAR